MSAGSRVKAGLVAYSQGAPEVIVRLDKPVARELRAYLEYQLHADLLPMPEAMGRLLDALRALDLEERPRVG